ncbi:oxygen-independent coproporphyrinogen III oxidase [Dehalococcoides mccartyi CG4]|uniref:radical SAM family heme chaperone HemW n=1 Tax=Dehalococcoides mccartyi TaxID=61435 RepID=UPI0004E02F75|nr:radical SAM family heme chaperone HemW [Dehalococcoides mccartyi]AII59534.1 oxygen-independent coproporphyrinogen III oxidase [Dehalococcoides mccartyi CG4]
MTDTSLALYLHFPFCLQKCGYCSFVSYPARLDCLADYVKCLRKEIKSRASGLYFHSLYFGGGTPSLLSPSQVADILAGIRAVAHLLPDAEITFEANPGTLAMPYLPEIKSLGINRLSLGIQSFSDAELTMLGRLHNAGKAREAYKQARAAGFNNISLDLIYGLPDSTVSSFKKNLAEALALAPEHISLYGLTLEEDTPMYRQVQEGLLPEINAETAADQYQAAEDILAKAGYRHYEISNWAKPGYESRHNLTYWQNRPYLGLGAAGHSFLENWRLANTSSLDEYLNSWQNDLPPKPSENIYVDLENQLAETIILGLRLDKGITAENIENRFGQHVMDKYFPVIQECTGLGLLEKSDGCISLTPRGRLLSNEVFWRFLP